MVAPASRSQSSGAQPKWASAGPAAHHHLGAAAQRGGNRFSADVGVGADDVQRIERIAQRLLQQRARGFAAQVVTLDHGDARRAQAQLRCERMDAPCRAGRVGRAEVADDANAVRQAPAQHRREQLHQQWLVAGVRVLPVCQLGQRQRAFGQGLEDQHGRSAGCDQRIHHRPGRVGAVTGEACRAAHAEHTGVRQRCRWG
jgi:hypothetical protein